MGLFSWLAKLFGMDSGMGDDHFFADDKTRKANALAAAHELGTLLGGLPKERDGGDEVHVSGEYEGLKMRAKFDVTFGGVELEAKTDAQIPEMLLVMHDSDGQAKWVMSREDRDEWDEDDFFDRDRVWLSEHVYVEDSDPEDLKQQRRTWEAIPSDLREELVALLEQGQASLVISSGELELKPWKGVLGRKDVGAVMAQYVQVLAKLGAALSPSRLRSVS